MNSAGADAAGISRSGAVGLEVEYKTAKGEKHELKIGEDGKLLKKKAD